MAFGGTYNQYRDKFEGEGSSEFWVNLALFNNKELSERDQQLLRSINQLKKIIYEVEFARKRGTTNIKLEQEMSRWTSRVKADLDYMVTTIGRWCEVKYAKNETDKGKIKAARIITERPLHQTDSKLLCKIARNFHDFICIKGIVPYTAGFSEETTMSRMRRG